MNRRSQILLLAGLLAALIVLVNAGTARADSATLAVLNTAGQPDPASAVARVFQVDGVASVPERLYVKYRAAGGAPCAPSAAQDSGTEFSAFYGVSVNGAFSERTATTWSSSGTYMFCIWLSTVNSSTIATPITQVVTFRSPTGAITANLAPLVPRPNEATTATITGNSEAPKRVYATLRAAGAPCAPTASLDDGGDYLISGTQVNGNFSLTATTSQSAPGNYVICLYLADGSSDTTPIAGPQAQPFSVVQPPAVASSLSPTNCRSTRTARKFRTRSTTGVCARFAFSSPPLAGDKITISFYTPQRKRYSTLSSTWSDSTTQPVVASGSLPPRAYKRRRGTWQMIMRVNGRQVRSTTFRVVR